LFEEIRGDAIKGPGLKADLDVRRLWECAKCERTLLVPSSRVAVPCPNCGEGVWMHLVEQQRVERPFSMPRPTEVEAEEIDEVENTSTIDSRVSDGRDIDLTDVASEEPSILPDEAISPAVADAEILEATVEVTESVIVESVPETIPTSAPIEEPVVPEPPLSSTEPQGVDQQDETQGGKRKGKRKRRRRRRRLGEETTGSSEQNLPETTPSAPQESSPPQQESDSSTSENRSRDDGFGEGIL